MRSMVLPLLLIATLGGGWLARAPSEKTKATARVDFATQIRPILERRCQPCHFTGGKMYDALPFDRPATIVKLGTKLFTRLKDEQERAIIRQFLAEQPARPSAQATNGSATMATRWYVQSLRLLHFLKAVDRSHELGPRGVEL